MHRSGFPRTIPEIVEITKSWRTQSPYPTPDASLGLRSEHFCYDGIRWIQEVVTDPVVSLGDTGDTGDAAMIAAVNAAQAESEQPLDGDAAPLTVEGAQTASRLPWWTLQDEGGDVVALCDRDPSTLRGRVVSQYTYDAYGSVVTAANLPDGAGQ
jgi:hypothetical protein